MAPVFDATIGGELSNSYADLVFADAYAANQSWGNSWLGLEEDARQIALIGATQWLETMSWKGYRCGSGQALAWPRSGISCDGVAATCEVIPLRIRQAEIQLAYQLSQDPTSIVPSPGGGVASGTYVSMQKLGDLEQQFSEYSSADSTCDSCGDPALLSAFPWLKDWLSCYLSGAFGSSKVLLRVRS